MRSLNSSFVLNNAISVCFGSNPRPAWGFVASVYRFTDLVGDIIRQQAIPRTLHFAPCQSTSRRLARDLLRFVPLMTWPLPKRELRTNPLEQVAPH